MNEDWNAMIYDSDELMSGKKLFGWRIDELYKLKTGERRNIVAGAMLRMIHGCLFTAYKNKIPKKTWIDKYADKKHLFYGIDDEEVIVYCEKRPFKFDFARCKVFLMSWIRLDFYKRFLHNKDYDIYRIYVDSILINKKLDEDEINTNIGYMKLEKTFNKASIHRVNCKPKSL